MKWLKAFLDGAASLLDLGGTLSRHDPAPDPVAADRAALRRDWQAVGDDLRRAMNAEPSAALVVRLLRAERLIAAHHEGASVEAHGTTCAICQRGGYFREEEPIHWRPLTIQRGD